jgi:hypothetical protein
MGVKGNDDELKHRVIRRIDAGDFKWRSEQTWP